MKFGACVRPSFREPSFFSIFDEDSREPCEPSQVFFIIERAGAHRTKGRPFIFAARSAHGSKDGRWCCQLIGEFVLHSFGKVGLLDIRKVTGLRLCCG